MNDTILDGLSWCKWARSCILTSHVIKRLHIWQVKLRISDRWCHSQSMQRAFPVRAMVITLSEICMNFAVKIVFLLCFGALVRSDYWQVWTTRPKPQCTRLWRSDVELFEHWTCDAIFGSQNIAGSASDRRHLGSESGMTNWLWLKAAAQKCSESYFLILWYLIHNIFI